MASLNRHDTEYRMCNGYRANTWSVNGVFVSNNSIIIHVYISQISSYKYIKSK